MAFEKEKKIERKKEREKEEKECAKRERNEGV